MGDDEQLDPELKKILASFSAFRRSEAEASNDPSLNGERAWPEPFSLEYPSPQEGIGPLDPEYRKLFDGFNLERWRTHIKGSLAVGAVIIPDKPVDEGTLVRSVGDLWLEIAKFLSLDWSWPFR